MRLKRRKRFYQHYVGNRQVRTHRWTIPFKDRWDKESEEIWRVINRFRPRCWSTGDVIMDETRNRFVTKKGNRICSYYKWTVNRWWSARHDPNLKLIWPIT